MTEPSMTAVPSPTPVPAKQRERSTIGFPYYSLNDSFQVAQTVHGLGDRCGQDQLVTPLGYSSIENGSFSLRLAAARHFGLIEYSKEGVTLSPLGRRIVDPTQESRARADAFLMVPLYKRLYDDYKGHSLPNTNIGIEAVLVNYGVAEKQKDKARQVLQRSAEQAGFTYQGKDRLVLPAIANQPETPHVEQGQQGEKGETGGSGSGGGSGGEGPRRPPLVKGMYDMLPSEGGEWTVEERDQWLQTIKLIFDMVYTIKKPAPLALPAANGAYKDA